MGVGLQVYTELEAGLKSPMGWNYQSGNPARETRTVQCSSHQGRKDLKVLLEITQDISVCFILFIFIYIYVYVCPCTKFLFRLHFSGAAGGVVLILNIGNQGKRKKTTKTETTTKTQTLHGAVLLGSGHGGASPS